MKTYIYTLFTILISFSAIAQTTDIVTGISDPKRMLLDDNTLYYATDDTLFKIDITEATPVPQQVIAGLAGIRGLAIDGNTLYISEFSAGRISTIDVTDTNPTRLDFITGLNTPNYLLIDGDFLYYSDPNSSIVERIDITETTPTRVLVSTSGFNFSPTGLAIQGDILYMAQGIADRVSIVNVADANTSPTNLVTMLNVPLGIVIDNNQLFIAERFDNKISVKDLSSSGPFATDLVTGLDNPFDIAINDTTIFILENGANKISKFDRALGIGDFSINNISISPNPAEDFIKVNMLSETENYNIYDILGKQIANGSISPMERLDISDLSGGMYLLKISEKEAVRFIKK
ncbi:T9SS type A sorting domain-containing protein [Psychroserpens sp.]|uniref:T9SS type A sorting domain-containing protein n=1 Tax=Psychroserpens sp. TaxID=2020870 RepID=UPI002B26CF1E|nr:T9SS type A sorting domain-containing protein [Psychroserpens sp.]